MIGKNFPFSISCPEKDRRIHFPFERGQSLVELLIAIGLSSIILPALLTGFVASREGKAQQKQREEAVRLLQEAEEGTRSVREKGWSIFAQNGTFYPHISTVDNSWELLPSASGETIGDFTRTIVISDTNRDSSGAIVPAPAGAVDPSTKKGVITVSWSQPRSSSATSTIYLTRYLDNVSYTETTQTQFNAGTGSGIAVQATNPPGVSDDGEIILASGGNSDWCSPSLATNTLDLPKNGVANALYAIEGTAFTATGENSSGVSFAKVTITGTSPPVPSLANTFDGYKTNGIFGESNYAYIATDNNVKHVVIIDLNQVVNGKYVEVGYLDAGTSTNAKSVFVAANTAYVTIGDDLYTFDVSNKSGAHTKLDSIDLPGTSGTSVVVNGNYAYVAIEGDAKELQIVNVGNPSDLSLAGYADVNGQAAQDVAINSTATRAYLATNASSSQHEMFIIDISTKTGSRPAVGSYEANGMDPHALTLVPGNKVIMVGTSGEEYQVINVSTESSPVRCGGVEVNNGINDIASILEADNDAYSYILVATDPEFRIVAGGSGGGYASSGTFESQTFNPGYTTANNRFTATFVEPVDTNLEFQVSMANLVSGSCPTTGNYTFVGPDGTSNTRFNPTSGTAVTFPFASYLNYSNPGQCLRYKVYFTTTNITNTPVLQEVQINYSP